MKTEQNISAAPLSALSRVFVNRTLNLKKIKYVGLDMDHTLIRYHSQEFERISYTLMKEKLVRTRGYSEKVMDLEFDFNLAIRGLVIDRHKGNLLKLNRHSAIRTSSHGLQPLDYKTQQKVYKSTYVDLGDKEYLVVDTTFSISLATLYAQLVDLKDRETSSSFPDYGTMANDTLAVLDEIHRGDSLKGVVRQNLDQLVVRDPETVKGLEKLKRHGKKLFIVTNSDFNYTKMLLDFALNPFLKDHANWQELFELVITFAQKPRFFFDNLKFLKVNPHDGTMVNLNDKLTPGIYQGGDAKQFTRDLELEGDEILYVGDHIYGDILRLKKDCGWRTAMVIEDLSHEIEADKKAQPLVGEIERWMKEKEPLEEELTRRMTLRIENMEQGLLEEKMEGSEESEKKETKEAADFEIEDLQRQITEIDAQISQLIKKQQSLYNRRWGQLMRAGNEESYFAYQVDRFACVYMCTLNDLLSLSPRSYFRAHKRLLAHEIPTKI